MRALPGASELLEIAAKNSGHRDVGDPRFIAAIDQLVRSINAESELPDEGPGNGYEAARERLLRLVENRQRIQAELAAHPEILKTTLQPPLIIGGLPRVGSTKLHQLLAKTGDFQSLLFWQGYNPARRQGERAAQEQSRIEDAARFLEWRSRRNPASNAAHFLAATEPEEDTYLLEFTLHTYWPVSYFEVPAFLRWLDRQDREHAYAYLRTLLQYLQWQFHQDARPRPWVLKSPPNLGFEPQMARQLPGARFVMLHRNPVESIPSTVAIVRELRRLYGDGAGDLTKAGAWAMAEYSGAINRHLQWRKTLPAGAVLDLAYAEVRDHYEQAVEKVYAFCGMTLSADARQGMESWAGDNEQHKHGVHNYSLDEAGLSQLAIRNRFAEYLETFAAYI